MNRLTFQQLAEERLADAKGLATLGRFAAAYYLAGYAVECALKACICRQTMQDDFPRRDASKLYTHNLKELSDEVSKIPGVDWSYEMSANAQLQTHWRVVRDWREDSRYDFRDAQEAEDLIAAIENNPDGVLTCLRKHW